MLSILCEKPLSLDKFFDEYQYVKQSHWAYQREWRVLTYKRHGESGLFSDFPFDPRELRAVFVGPRMPSEEAQVVRQLLPEGLEHVRVLRAIEDQKELSLRFEAL
jgi:hypothetical protein